MANYDVIFVLSGFGVLLAIVSIVVIKIYHRRCEHKWHRIDVDYRESGAYFRCDKCGSVKCEEDKELK